MEGRYIGGEMEGKRQWGTDKGKETEGNRHRERDIQERGGERRKRGEGGGEEGEREGERETERKRHRGET
jgi:hypothetical protein